MHHIAFHANQDTLSSRLRNVSFVQTLPTALRALTAHMRALHAPQDSISPYHHPAFPAAALRLSAQAAQTLQPVQPAIQGILYSNLHNVCPVRLLLTARRAQVRHTRALLASLAIM